MNWTRKFHQVIVALWVWRYKKHIIITQLTKYFLHFYTLTTWLSLMDLLKKDDCSLQICCSWFFQQKQKQAKNSWREFRVRNFSYASSFCQSTRLQYAFIEGIEIYCSCSRKFAPGVSRPWRPTAGISSSSSVACPLPSSVTEFWSPGCPLGTNSCGWSKGACS